LIRTVNGDVVPTQTHTHTHTENVCVFVSVFAYVCEYMGKE